MDIAAVTQRDWEAENLFEDHPAELSNSKYINYFFQAAFLNAETLKNTQFFRIPMFTFLIKEIGMIKN